MPTDPTTTKGIRTRANILAAARRVFARDGYVDSRMSDIAAEAGLSTGGLYRYFESKREVFAALIADLHEELYEASGHTDHRFDTEPKVALMEANRGYVTHYYENRDVMRAFIEAASVDERFRRIWWEMRARHASRFHLAAMRTHGVTEVADVDARRTAEAMACMVEQCCYVWFAQEQMDSARISVEDAIAVVSNAWFQSVFAPADPTASPAAD